MVEGLLVCECTCAAERGEMQGSVVGGGRLAEYEELYKEENQKGYGKLAEHEALCK